MRSAGGAGPRLAPLRSRVPLECASRLTGRAVGVDAVLRVPGAPQPIEAGGVVGVSSSDRRQRIADQLRKARVDVQLFGTTGVEHLMDDAFEAVQTMIRKFAADQAQGQLPEGDYLDNLKEAFKREAVPAIRALAEAMRDHVTPHE